MRLGALTAEVALASLPSAEQLVADCRTYGCALFDALLPTPELRLAIDGLGRNDRLALITGDDPLLASIPWEYLRTPPGGLLAARVPFVRALPTSQRREAFRLGSTVEVLAVPMSPIDDTRVGLFAKEKAHVERQANALGISLAATLRLFVIEDMQRAESGGEKPTEKVNKKAGLSARFFVCWWRRFPVFSGIGVWTGR